MVMSNFKLESRILTNMSLPDQQPQTAQLTKAVSVSSLLSNGTPIKTESEETPPAKKIRIEESEVQRAEHKTEQKVKSEEPKIPSQKEPPVHEMVGGSSVRQYLNKNLTMHLLEGLKMVSKSKPEDPLEELGRFLIQRSEELKQSR